jgi:RNA polymerase sigma factor (sigma-70 family)
MISNRIATDPMVCLFETGSATGLSDWQLLQQFVDGHDALPFEVLVSRHGPMVLGICRRMLRNSPDVDDAFQATFLVLLKRAGSLGPGDVIAGWLHGVAVRVAQQARTAAGRRARRERNGITLDLARHEPAGLDATVRHVLDQEIGRLPAKYRDPIVLCYLQGKTHEEAARQLRWPLGSVKGRLARGRSLLQSRLARRGVTCGTALAALAAGSSSRASVPASLHTAACQAAIRVSAGGLIAHGVPGSIAQLTQGVLSAMIKQKLKLIILACALSGVFLTGAGVLARQSGPSNGPRAVEPPTQGQERLVEKAKTSGPVVVETQKKEIPRKWDAGERYRELIQAARKAYLANEDEWHKGKSPMGRIYGASRLLMESEREAASSPAEKIKAVQNHLERMRTLARDHQAAGDVDDADGAEVRAYVAEADLLLAQAKTPAKPAPVPAPTPAHPGRSDGPGKDVRSQVILAKLEQPIAMSFASETPLEDLLKYIKQATQGPSEPGIPIYVDPIGLQEAEKSLTSTIHIDLDGVPLRRTLQLALSQIGLMYFVDDGILVITSQESENQRLPPSSVEPSPFLMKQEKAERGEMTLKEMKEFVEELKVRKEMNEALNEMHSAGEGGTPGPNAGAKQAQTDQLVKELRELVGQLKSGKSKQ